MLTAPARPPVTDFESALNWEAPAGDERWTVHLGGGFGRVFAIGDQKVNASLQAYWNAVKPDTAGDWTLRAQFQFLFPR